MSSTLKRLDKFEIDYGRLSMTSSPVLDSVHGDVLRDQDVHHSFTREEAKLREESRRRTTYAMLQQ